MGERIQKYEEKMQKTLKGFEAELQTIRAGRANPHILDKLTVDYYGTPTPIQQVANVTVPEARMIQIQPWESSLIKKIDPCFRSGPEPQQRRQDHPSDIPGAHRGTS